MSTVSSTRYTIEYGYNRNPTNALDANASLSLFLSLPLRRVLNKKLLSTVLMYLGPDSSAKTVCKYWKAVMKEAS